jgi:hypothetical protein
LKEVSISRFNFPFFCTGKERLMVGIRDFARRGQHEALLKWAMDIGFSPGSAADDLVRDLARVSQRMLKNFKFLHKRRGNLCMI